MKLQSAIAFYLTERIPELHAFKDEIAFVAAGNPYPYLLIDLISTRRKAVGTGVWDRTHEGIATKAVSVQQVLRFTVRAANTVSRNGNAHVDEICDRIDALLMGLCREGSVDLPVPDSEDFLHIERIVFQGRYDLPPIEKGMPFVYQQALSFLFVEQQVVSKPVTTNMNKISISFTES
ncbi:MAG: hypothetical protein FJY67_10700 [Calditrichaeota bacterium]|nr:hypothetical protein [Calditrichota bacterium]